jgi:hypothetical protein
MRVFHSGLELLNDTMLANWRLCGIKTILLQSVDGIQVIRPEVNVGAELPESAKRRYVTNIKVVSPVHGLDGLGYYVEKENIIITGPSDLEL